MPADVWRRRLSIAALGVCACLATASFGVSCRTAGAATKSGPGPALQSVVAAAETSEIAALPDGAAKTIVTERCLLCHGAALIAQQRKDAAAWGRTVTQMRTWGTPIQDEHQTALVAYLTEHFGPGAKR
jgi:cytochrome c5